MSELGPNDGTITPLLWRSTLSQRCKHSITQSLGLSQRTLNCQWQRNDISTTCSPEGEKRKKNKSWCHNFNSNNIQLRLKMHNHTLLTYLCLFCWQALGTEASPNPGESQAIQPEPKRALNYICWFDLAKDQALHFLAKQEMGKNSRSRLGDGTMTLAGAHSTANMSHLRNGVSVGCELGVNNTWHDLNSVAGVMNGHSPLLLVSGSVEGSAGWESWGWFYTFLFPSFRTGRGSRCLKKKWI